MNKQINSDSSDLWTQGLHGVRTTGVFGEYLFHSVIRFQTYDF